MILEHKVIDATNEKDFRDKLNAASKKGWVLSSQFQISMALDSSNNLVKCYHIMVSKKVEEKGLKAVKDKTVN